MDTPALTEEQFKAALPEGMSKQVNPLLIMHINNTLSSQEEMDNYKENLLTYTSVLREGKFRMSQYLNAVRYVGFKTMGCTNIEAYAKTFPDKYRKFQLENRPQKEIASYCTAYNKSKLVNLIFEQTLIPSHILNAPVYQDAINAQIDLMHNAKSEMVRCTAANSLLIHLKGPETKKFELDIGVHQSNVIDDYQKAMAQMVEKQLELMSRGGDVKQITNAPIKYVEGEVIE